ncbi:MAG: response regulator [Planctomycetota bacterium]|nr:response regulator [Planctomycetota bacterium]
MRVQSPLEEFGPTGEPVGRVDVGAMTDIPAKGPTPGAQSGASGMPLTSAGLDWTLSLLNSVGEGVCLFGPLGETVWANDLFQAVDDQVRARVAELARLRCKDQPRTRTAQAPASRAQPSQPVIQPPARHEIASSDGQRVYELMLSDFAGIAPRSSDGPEIPAAVVAVVRDLTLQRRSLDRMDAIDRAGAELVRIEADVVRKLNSVERLKYLEQKIVKYTRELLRFDHFAIRLQDERSGKLELVIAYGLPAEFDSFDLYPRTEGCGISGYVAATGRSYVCKDVATDELFLPGLPGAKSSLTVPLLLHDKVIGIFNIESNSTDAFGDEERRLAEMFSRYIAIALHTLDLLVVERSTVNKSVSARVEDEIDEPLKDIAAEVGILREVAQRDPELASHVERIMRDVTAIRERLHAVASGPQTLLGVDKAMAVRAKDPVLSGKRILVADDEPKIRRIIHDVLKNRGCEVVVFESGVQAIAALEEVAAHPEAPGFDMIVSDIKMPDRNGYEVFASARKYRATIPVLLMTGFGYDPHHSIVRASQEGLQGVLFKPFQIERLIDEVRKALSAVAGQSQA